MTRQSTSIGLLAPNEALTELLSATLAAGGYRCAAFTKAQNLTTYMRLAPVQILLLDPNEQDVPIMAIAAYMRATKAAYPLFRMIALTSVQAAFHRPFIATGLDAIVCKPVRPVGLLHQVDKQREALKQLPSTSPFCPPVTKKHTDNVVSLFK